MSCLKYTSNGPVEVKGPDECYHWDENSMYEIRGHGGRVIAIAPTRFLARKIATALNIADKHGWDKISSGTLKC